MVDQVVADEVPVEAAHAVGSNRRSVPHSVAASSEAGWVALGDSLTTGAGDVPHGGGWVARAAAALVSDGLIHEVHNLARPGVRMAEILAEQVPLLQGRQRIVSAIGGANDVLALRWDVSVFRDRLNRFLDIAARHGSLVLTSTCPDFFVHRFGPHSTLSRRVAQLNEAVLGRARGDDRVVVLDTYRVLQDASLWHEDGIHANHRGHKTLAANALRLLRERMGGLEIGTAGTASRG